MHSIFIKTVMAVVLIALTFSSVAFSQDAPAPPVRLRFARGKNTTTARGFIGGESTDRYIVRLRAGQTLIIQAISRLKRTQVGIFRADTDDYLEGKQSENDSTRWVGKIPRTGDYVIHVNVHPYAERYLLKLTVK
jgi:hypothetical protein